MTLACSRSSAGLAATRRQKSTTIQPRPTTAPASPAPASPAWTWLPASHNPQPAACEMSGARSCRASSAGTAQPFGARREQEAGEEQRDEAEGHDRGMRQRRRYGIRQAKQRAGAVNLNQSPPYASTRQHGDRQEKPQPVRRQQKMAPAPCRVHNRPWRARQRPDWNRHGGFTRRSRDGRTGCSSHNHPCGSPRGRRIRCTSCRPSPGASGRWPHWPAAWRQVRRGPADWRDGR